MLVRYAIRSAFTLDGWMQRGLHVYLRQPDGLFSKEYEWDSGIEDALRLLL